MTVRKVYIQVAARFLAEGGLVPEEIVWGDGRRFTVKRVISMARAPSAADAALPVRCLCVIGDKKKRLYFEPERLRWYVEVADGKI